MSEIYTKIICSTMMSILGFYVIKKVLNSKTKLLSIKTIICLIVLTTVALLLHKNQYTGIYTIAIFLLNIIAYKHIFNMNYSEALICVAILMIIMFIGDLMVSLIFTNLYTVEQIRNNWLLYIITNLLVCIFSVILINIKIINNKIRAFYLSVIPKRSLINIIYFILIIIGLSLLTYNLSITWNWDANYITNIVIIVTLGVTTYIFIDNKYNYNKLVDEYDNLFNYIQNFEDWIEKEQLNRHEYKNQLAVLRDITKEKKTKDKINEILEDNINIEGDIINQLKILPKGGVKGLMYYKLVIAQKNKINLAIDVSTKKTSVLNKLSEKRVKDLCRLIGIYFDNAIEAASKTRKKRVLIEIYDLKDRVNIVFSNTFKNSDLIDHKDEKGVSSKGKGHGNGLYFAKKILSKNNWLEEKQEIIDGYYIQKLSILKLEK